MRRENFFQRRSAELLLGRMHNGQTSRLAAYPFGVAATVRSRDGNANCWASASISFPLEHPARDLTVAATSTTCRAGARRTALSTKDNQP